LRLLASASDTAVADHHEEGVEIDIQTNRAGQQSRWKKFTPMPGRASLLQAARQAPVGAASRRCVTAAPHRQMVMKEMWH
jgi:hypothetical protein